MGLTSQVLEDYNNNLIAFKTKKARITKQIEDASKRLHKLERNYPSWLTCVKIICNALYKMGV